MKKVEIIATKKARSMKAGTRTSMAAHHAKVLVLDGQAVYAETAPAVEAPQTRAKRTYNRRDMVAQPTQEAATPVSSSGVTGTLTSPTYRTKFESDV